MTVRQAGNIDNPVLPTPEIKRRKSVHIAIADSLMEGLPPPSNRELEIYEAFIRGEIDPGDLVEVMKRTLLQS